MFSLLYDSSLESKNCSILFLWKERIVSLLYICRWKEKVWSMQYDMSNSLQNLTLLRCLQLAPHTRGSRLFHLNLAYPYCFCGKKILDMYKKKIRRPNSYLPNSCTVQRLTVVVTMALNRKVIGDYKQFRICFTSIHKNIIYLRFTYEYKYIYLIPIVLKLF